MSEDSEARRQLRRVETGAISEDEFGVILAEKLGVSDSENLIDRLFAGMQADQPMIDAVKSGQGRGHPHRPGVQLDRRRPLRPLHLPRDVRRRGHLRRGGPAQAPARDLPAGRRARRRARRGVRVRGRPARELRGRRGGGHDRGAASRCRDHAARAGAAAGRRRWRPRTGGAPGPVGHRRHPGGHVGPRPRRVRGRVPPGARPAGHPRRHRHVGPHRPLDRARAAGDQRRTRGRRAAAGDLHRAERRPGRPPRGHRPRRPRDARRARGDRGAGRARGRHAVAPDREHRAQRAREAGGAGPGRRAGHGDRRLRLGQRHPARAGGHRAAQGPGAARARTWPGRTRC